MSITFGFYNSLNGDRKYDAKQMSRLFEGIITDGVFMGIGDALIVNALTGMRVSVGLGRAWFNRTWTNNDTPHTLTLDNSNLVLNRIDAVVLEVNTDESVRANTIKIIKGTADTTPVKPAMVRSELVNQYPLCYVMVIANSTSVLPENIENVVGTSECPFITGVMETINTDALLAQWNAEFNVWFASLADILDENVAGNLLNLINQNKTSIKLDAGYTTKERLLKDDNDIFTELQYKRSDGTLYKKSVLSGGVSPLYTNRTATYYDVDGTTVISTENFNLNYIDEILTSEVIV